MKKNLKPDLVYAFTIVELLIVIVIIGILAAITIASYTGMTKKANEATVQADLANASKKIKLYYILYNSYPESMPNDGTGRYCPSGPIVDTDYCIKPSTGTFNYSALTPTVDFNLVANSGTFTYIISKDSQPTSATITPITAVGAIIGTAQIGQVLTAGGITPAGATVSYQWQAATTTGGVYSDIAGATASTYAVSPNIMGKYVKLTVTGTGLFSGNQISNNTAQIPIDNTNWLTIGGQTWAKANLNVGVKIANSNNQADNAIVEKYCYSDSDSNCTSYGGFYQWNEAMQYVNTEKARGICSAGSHIPSDDEWKLLESSLGMAQLQLDIQGSRGTDQGFQLMNAGSSGMNIPLSGFRNNAGFSSSMSSSALIWSSTESGPNAWDRNLSSGYGTIYRGPTNKVFGSSVRCVGD